MKHKLYIISAGPGNPNLLSIQAKKLLDRLDHILCFERLAPLVKDSERLVMLTKLSDAKDLCEAYLKDSDIGLLVSGSASFHSIVPFIKKSLANDVPIEIIPGISSIDYLLAKLCIQKEDCVFESCHGQNLSFDMFYEYAKNHKYLALLCDKLMNPQVIAQKLIKLGCKDCYMHVGSSLSYPDEVIVTKTVQEIASMSFSNLSICLINLESFSYNKVHFGLDARYFKKHPNVPVTKAEVRSVILSKLNLFDSNLLWDVGAGSGSVSIEACLLNPHLRAFCFEKNEYAIDNLKENLKDFKLSERIDIVEGLAPDSFIDLELPSAVFIGGSSGKLEEILIYLICHAKKDIRVVVSAISLENAYLSYKIMSQVMFKDLNFEQVSISRLTALASSKVLRAENPVFVISATITVNEKGE